MSKIQILAGHGCYDQKNGTFTVPAGMSVHFFCAHGESAIDSAKINRKIKENCGAVKRDGLLTVLQSRFKQSITGGNQCFNYTLVAPTSGTKVAVLPKSKTIKQLRNQEEGLLGDFVAVAAMKEIEDVVFYACRNYSKTYGKSAMSALNANEVHFIMGKYGGVVPDNLAKLYEDMMLAGM